MSPVGIGIVMVYAPFFLVLIGAAVIHRWRKRRAFENTVRDALTFSATPGDDQLAPFIHAYLCVDIPEPVYRTDQGAS